MAPTMNMNIYLGCHQTIRWTAQSLAQLVFFFLKTNFSASGEAFSWLSNKKGKSGKKCVVSGEELFSSFCLINFCAMSLIILIHNTLKSFEIYNHKFSFRICALTSWNENICHPAEITATTLEKWKKIFKAGLPSVLCSENGKITLTITFISNLI